MPGADFLPCPEAKVSSRRIKTLGQQLVFVLVICGIAWFFGGLAALSAAAVGLLVARVVGPGWVAAAAVGSLLVAAVATVVEAKLTHSYNLTFAEERPIATQSALVAGALAFVAAAVFAARERASVASESIPYLHWRAEGRSPTRSRSSRSRRSRRRQRGGQRR
jgi:hypothetical protein